MAKRDKLESGAALPEGCAVGVSLHYVSVSSVSLKGSCVVLGDFILVFGCIGDGILLE